jgi:DNA-directed RNA polymerase beta subunit
VFFFLGMLLESIAGKAAAVYGSYQDATPFRTYEKHPPMPHTCNYHKNNHGTVPRKQFFLLIHSLLQHLHIY